MDNAKQFVTGIGLEPQSADPANAVEGDLQYADGTARTEGIYVFKDAAWVELAAAAATNPTVVTKTGNYTVLSTDDTIIANGGGFTLTLPASASNSGKIYNISKVDTGTTEVTIDGNASETIDGALTMTLSGQYTSVQIVSDGTNWFTISDDRVLIGYVFEEQTGGTDGGTFTSGALRTRTLNTTGGDFLKFAALSSNQFTLEIGTYAIEAFAPAIGVNEHQAILRNITDSTTDLEGMSQYAADSDITCTICPIIGTITITAAKAFEIQHRGSVTEATQGFGNGSTFAVNEVFTHVKITKIA